MILTSIPLPSRAVLTMATVEQAREAGATPAAVGQAVQTEASRLITAAATELRARVAPTEPAKIAEYELKARLAAMPAASRPAPLVAALTTEAQARGLTLAALLTLIGQREAALAEASLQIAAWEAQEKADLAALDAASPEIETLVANALASARKSANALMAQIQGAQS
jgi:hypothetical protein